MIFPANDEPGFEWHVLQCHPVVPQHRLTQVRAGIARHKDLLALRYEIIGDLQVINIPASTPSLRRDELWLHTCAELFITTEESAKYVEYNFSPSSQWAAYSFSDYRQGMELLPTESPEVVRLEEQSRLLITAAIRTSDQYRGVAIRAGLSMVIENNDGACSYWALRHDLSRPDFHRRENWLCSLP
jgi:hypothetical protein